MVYKDIKKPTPAMLLTPTQMNQLIREQELKYADKSKAEEEHKAKAEEKERNEYVKQKIREQQTRENYQRDRAAYFSNLKTALVSECLFYLYKKSYPGVLTEQDTIVARNLVTRFVKENGAGNLMRDFRTKNMVLSEFSRICDKYYKMALNEDAQDDGEDRPAIGIDVKECDFNTTIADDFYKDLADVDIDVASKTIKDRVSDAINQFIDDNAAAKMDYQDIIQSAKDKMAVTSNEESGIQYMNRAKAKINEMQSTRSHNVLHSMVESLTKSVLRDSGLKARYVHEGQVDMGAVVDSATLVYTMLEMTNTTNMVNVNGEFIKKYLATLAA